MTEQNVATGVTRVCLAGELSPATVPTCRNVIGKAAAQCPVAVIVDLSDLDRAETRSLRVFAKATLKAQQEWSVPVLLCEPGAEVRRGLETFRTLVAVYDHHWQASLAVRAYVPRWVRQRFAPLPESAADARSLIGQACLDWGLPSLRDTARLVASELASNAIRHAATDFDVMASFTGRYLRIAVRDGSRVMPALVQRAPTRSSIMPAGSGRGMRIISAAGSHCGVIRVAEGKTVWVLISADR
ncbi:ATP-binding protein [Actinoplanes palleronii]|uniref:STAS domain-containing protein n=1 Tax=Actinoplanes palleronii TaxID=113570 RepID=A0ABQ4BBW2_9ACTN|nr:ATP-binding protein [Actinoplanes palleronii]GIE68151.1 STAS domain-containing protein [Actinoplanes palleronii]